MVTLVSIMLIMKEASFIMITRILLASDVHVVPGCLSYFFTILQVVASGSTKSIKIFQMLHFSNINFFREYNCKLHHC